MARIKVTGYIDVNELEPDQRDDTHEMGLSNKGYEELTQEFSGQLDDIEFERVDD